MYYLIKIAVTTILIVVISEVSKRSSFVGALLASIPLISVMAMLWLYVDTKDAQKVSDLAISGFWLVIPSLVLFISLPVLLKNQVDFYLSLFLSIVFTIIAYWLMIFVLNHFGIKL